jgi:pimeloyl-ACP methyl ester carboxylesterase
MLIGATSPLVPSSGLLIPGLQPPSVTRRLAAVLVADVAGYSRLMSDDDLGTVRRLHDHRAILVRTVAEHGGRLVNTVGDSMLAEFPSVLDAVKSALAVQERLAQSNTLLPEERRLELRLGVHVGDILVRHGDIYGKLACELIDRGTHRVKNIARPVHVYALRRPERQEKGLRTQSSMRTQEIHYCRAPDGVRLAWSRVGQGAPLLKAANWLSHLEHDWESPVWSGILDQLASGHSLFRYDARGNGLSDWELDTLSLDAWVDDLKAVADAAGLERFPLLGISQGCAVSVAFAVRYPERVSHLIFYGGFALGPRKRSAEMQAKRDAMATLMRLGWGADEPVFRQLFTSQFMPEATKVQADAFNELQYRSASPECAARYYDTVGDLDVRDILPEVKAPTLVMHVRGDLVAPLCGGRELAAAIPGARFVAFEGHNHLLQEGEPAFDRFFEELSLFLASVQ